MSWVFPKLMAYRRPQYERLASQYGYTIDAGHLFELRDEQDVIDLIAQAAGDG